MSPVIQENVRGIVRNIMGAFSSGLFGLGHRNEMRKGRSSLGKRHSKTHMLRGCGSQAYDHQKWT